MPWLRALTTLFQVAASPRRSLARLAEQPSVARTLLAAMAVGLLWSLFSWRLHAAGHAPGGPLVMPIARAHYYLYQAFFIVPLFAIMALLAPLAGHALARRLGGQGTRASSLSSLGYALLSPLLLAWLLPDIVIYVVAGFTALTWVAMVAAPVAGLCMLTLTTFAALRSHPQLSRARAFAVALTTVCTQALLVSPLLR